MLYSLSVCVLLSIAFSEPNPPIWPENVLINPTQSQIDTVYAEQGGHQPAFNGQWSNDRYALLFQPGSYTSLTINVGFYTTVMGLGKSPSDTVLGNVICENGDFDYTGGALDNFWRSIENFETTPTTTWQGGPGPNTMLWAVSQASPMRRIKVNGNLMLWQYNSGCCAGYASGGFMADVEVSGTISSGSQQQWMTRNTNMGKWDGGVWNMVFAGSNGAPATHCSDTNGAPATTTGAVAVIAEKPYIYYGAGKYYLQIPAVETNKMGATANYGANDKSVDFANVYVTKATDTGATINSKLSSGINYLVITPGNYNISTPIMISRSNMVILGIGMPVLTASNGNVIIQVASNLDGVRISGLLLQAGPKKSISLLSVGTASGFNSGYQYDQKNPTIIYDVFARVGGTNNPAQYQVSTEFMFQIFNDYVIIDDTWLWRADHDISGAVKNSDNPVATGCAIYGDGVTTYGLAAEHTLGNLVEWGGNNGKAYFYQSEFPYDVTQANYGAKGYSAFVVNQTVTNFEGYGIAAYCYFRDNTVTVQNGISTPTGSGITMVDSLSVFLNGNGGIEHVIDGQGSPVEAAGQQAYVCSL